MAEKIMLFMRAWLLVAAALAGSLQPAASGSAFPFGSDLMLDATPMRGSKRVPILQIDENGAASIDLWCASARGEARVADNTITITPGPATATQCSPERSAGDADLLAALGQVTSWRRNGDLVELFGSTTLRFRLMTN